MHLSIGIRTQISAACDWIFKGEFDGTGCQPMNEQQKQQLEQRKALYKTALGALEKSGRN